MDVSAGADRRTDDGRSVQESPDAAGGSTQERTRVLLITDLGSEEPGNGPPILDSEALAAMLADPFGGSADCDSGLELAPGNSADCLGPASPDETGPVQEWHASVVMVPTEDGFEAGSRVAVLFNTGTDLPADADALLDEDVSVTGLGFGSAFGAEDLTTDELEDSTLQVLTSENAYVPVHEAATWKDVTCSGGMNFEDFATVDCTASTAEGEQWPLHVAPGAFADNHPGLLVGIENERDG